MPELDELVARLREELDAEKEDAQRRHDELLAELRGSRPRGTRRTERGYEQADDPGKARRRRRGKLTDEERRADAERKRDE